MEEILINIVNQMEKKLIFVDEYHIIRYLNQSAKEHYLKKGYKNLIGTSIFKFHSEETKEKIKIGVRVLKSNKTLVKVTVGQTDIFPVWIKERFVGYYEIF